MNIQIINQQSALLLSQKHLSSFVKAILSNEKVKTDQVILHFVGKQAIKKLHKKHFDDPTETDCITLPIDPPDEIGQSPHILGEAYICTEVACEYALAREIDPYDETALYIIHCLLHLIGYNDILENEQKIMRKKEKKCMDLIKERALGLCEKHTKRLLKQHHAK